jgi:hypothetical protein
MRYDEYHIVGQLEGEITIPKVTPLDTFKAVRERSDSRDLALGATDVKLDAGPSHCLLLLVAKLKLHFCIGFACD